MFLAQNCWCATQSTWQGARGGGVRVRTRAALSAEGGGRRAEGGGRRVHLGQPGVAVEVQRGHAAGRLGVGRRRIGGFGLASRPHHSLPWGPARPSGSSRVRSAARSLESPPLEAGAVCGGTTKTALWPCGSPQGRQARDGGTRRTTWTVSRGGIEDFGHRSVAVAASPRHPRGDGSLLGPRTWPRASGWASGAVGGRKGRCAQRQQALMPCCGQRHCGPVLRQPKPNPNP